MFGVENQVRVMFLQWFHKSAEKKKYFHSDSVDKTDSIWRYHTAGKEILQWCTVRYTLLVKQFHSGCEPVM